MPLNRAHVTSGSRVMLPVYFGVYLLLGLEFLLQDPARTSTPVFEPAKLLMAWLTNPMQGWGAVFLAIAGVEGVALALRHRALEIFGLSLGLGMAAFWAVLLLMAGIRDVHVSFTSGTWLLIPVAAHFASMLTLARREGPGQ